jgi:methylase of polypeptide subunit release factors
LDRLDLQYEALKILHNDKIYFAPLTAPKQILDIGTGTGIWAVEMGK